MTSVSLPSLCSQNSAIRGVYTRYYGNIFLLSYHLAPIILSRDVKYSFLLTQLPAAVNAVEAIETSDHDECILSEPNFPAFYNES